MLALQAQQVRTYKTEAKNVETDDACANCRRYICICYSGSAAWPARSTTWHPARTVGHRQEGTVDEVQQTQATAEPDAIHT